MDEAQSGFEWDRVKALRESLQQGPRGLSTRRRLLRLCQQEKLDALDDALGFDCTDVLCDAINRASIARTTLVTRSALDWPSLGKVNAVGLVTTAAVLKGWKAAGRDLAFSRNENEATGPLIRAVNAAVQALHDRRIPENTIANWIDNLRKAADMPTAKEFGLDLSIS